MPQQALATRSRHPAVYLCATNGALLRMTLWRVLAMAIVERRGHTFSRRHHDLPPDAIETRVDDIFARVYLAACLYRLTPHL